MDSYMKGAVEEYIKNNRAVLEDMCERGVFSSADVEEHLESIRVNIEKNIESNRAYALLMMEMDRGKAKTKYNNNYVSLTEIAKLKNFKNPSYVIQSWLRDRNTLEFLFQWELENNVAFDIQGHRQVEKKLSDPSFTLTLKIWKGYARAIGIESKQGNGGGTFAHIDIAIDFYAWVFPKKRYELLKLISGKLAFFETIKEELEQKKQTISKAAENLIDKNEQSLFELAK